MHIGKIGQKSAAFINHKPFHPGSYKNLEKVWIAEQKDAELKRKQQELLEQRLQEGKIEELRHALHTGQAAALNTYRTGTTDLQWVGGDDNDGQLSTVPSHIAREISDNKLDWMYQNASQIRADQDREKFLLGEKTIEDNEEDEKQALKELNEKTAGSLLLGAKSALTESVLLKRVREDPMFAVKQAELAHQQALQKNPLMRARLRAKAEEEAQRLAEEEAVRREDDVVAPPKKRHHRHHHRSHHKRRAHSTSDTDASQKSQAHKRSKRRHSSSRSRSGDRVYPSSPRERSRSPQDASTSPRRRIGFSQQGNGSVGLRRDRHRSGRYESHSPIRSNRDALHQLGQPRREANEPSMCYDEDRASQRERWSTRDGDERRTSHLETSLHRDRARSPQRARDDSLLRARDTGAYRSHNRAQKEALQNTMQRAKGRSPRRNRDAAPRNGDAAPRNGDAAPSRYRQLSPSSDWGGPPIRQRHSPPGRSSSVLRRRNRDTWPWRDQDKSPRRDRSTTLRRVESRSPRRHGEVAQRGDQDVSPRRSRDISQRRDGKRPSQQERSSSAQRNSHTASAGDDDRSRRLRQTPDSNSREDSRERDRDKLHRRNSDAQSRPLSRDRDGPTRPARISPGEGHRHISDTECGSKSASRRDRDFSPGRTSSRGMRNTSPPRNRSNGPRSEGVAFPRREWRKQSHGGCSRRRADSASSDYSDREKKDVVGAPPKVAEADEATEVPAGRDTETCQNPLGKGTPASDGAACLGAEKVKARRGPQVDENLLGRLRREGETAILGPPVEMVESLRRRQEQLRASKSIEAADAERLDVEGMRAEAEKYHNERRERLAELKKREAEIEEHHKAMSARRLPEEAPKFIRETRKDLLDTIDRVAQLHSMRRRDNLDDFQ